MKFKDLPNESEVIRLYKDKFVDSYSMPSINTVYLFHEHIGPDYKYKFTVHSNIYVAYAYLLENKDVEVVCDFFSDNFPFLYGYHIGQVDCDMGNGVNTPFLYSNSKILIDSLRIFNSIPYHFLEYGCDINYCNHEDNTSVYKFIDEQNKFLSVFGGYGFVTDTYDELIKRLSILEIMAS